MKGSCVLDLLACIPFTYLIHGTTGSSDPNNKDRLYALLKLLRFPRLLELLEVDRVKMIINYRLN